jgi:hypothetical protein
MGLGQVQSYMASSTDHNMTPGTVGTKGRSRALVGEGNLHTNGADNAANTIMLVKSNSSSPSPMMQAPKSYGSCMSEARSESQKQQHGLP